MVRRYFCLILFLLPLFCQGQEIDILPDLFGQITRTYLLIHPSASDQEFSKANLNIGERMNTGVFRNVRTYYINGSIQFKPGDTTKSNYHSVGLVFINDKEGNLFHRSRGYLTYSLHTPLFADYYLAGGVGIGFVNYVFDPTDVSPGGSAFSRDANVGLSIHSQRLYGGIAVHQPFNNTLQPIEQIYRLKTFYSCLLQYRFQLSENLEAEPAVHLRYAGSIEPVFYFQGLIVLQEKFSFGANFRPGRGFVLMAGIEKLLIYDHHFRAMISYTTPLITTRQTSVNALEFSLNYSFH